MTVEGDPDQLPEGEATFDAVLSAEAEALWQLVYGGDEGFDLRITEDGLKRHPGLAALLNRRDGQ